MKNVNKFYSSYHIREDECGEILTDKMEFHIIELVKLPKDSNSTSIYDWAKFITTKNREEFEMLAHKNKYLKEAYKQLDVISQDKQKRLEYFTRQKAIYDINTMMEEYFESGMK